MNPDRPPAPSQIGRFRVDALLGRGGMGEVYRGYDPLLQRDVALKVVRSDLQRPELLDRLLREALACARLQHPNIVTIYEAGELNGDLYIAMEFLKGESLDVVLRRGVPPDIDTAVDVLSQVLEALAHAHAAGVIHRDVKPSNVHRQLDGRIKLLDFGLARVADAEPLTRVGETLGTPQYASPEQLTGVPTDHRTDLYSTGILVYELLTGRRPFGAPGDNLAAIVAKVLLQPVPPLAMEGSRIAGFDAFIARAAAKSPDERFATARAMKAALSMLASDEPAAKGAGAPSSGTTLGRLTAFVPQSAASQLSYDETGVIVRFFKRPAVVVGGFLATLAGLGFWLLTGQPSGANPTPDNAPASRAEVRDVGPHAGSRPSTQLPRRDGVPANAKRLAVASPREAVRSDDRETPQQGAGQSASPPPANVVPAMGDPRIGGPTLPLELGAPVDAPSRPSPSQVNADAAQVPPVPVASGLSEADRTAIHGLLEAFAAAFANQSTPELRRLQPSLQASQLALYESRFLGSKVFTIQLRNVRLQPVSGSRVAVNCTLEREITFDDGSQRRHSGPAMLTVDREGEQWRIVTFRPPGWW